MHRGLILRTSGPIFGFDELVQAHMLMDENRAGGKIVVRGSTLA